MYGATRAQFYPIRSQYSRNLQQPDLWQGRFECVVVNETRNITFQLVSNAVVDDPVWRNRIYFFFVESDLFSRLFCSWWYGIQCFFHGAGCSSTSGIRGTMFILMYVVSYVGGANLLRHAEGATWLAIVTVERLTLRDGPLENLWGCGRSTKKYIRAREN